MKGKSHRQISKLGQWSVSSTIVRDELISDGVIVVNNVKMDKSGKNHVFYKLTGIFDKSSDLWDDGTPKSKNNAFDLSTARGLFNKAELAASMNKGKPNNYNTPVQIIAYSRA